MNKKPTDLEIQVQEAALRIFTKMSKHLNEEVNNRKPYYAEKYALMARGFLDMLHAPGSHSHIKVTLEGRNVDTVKLQIYQGMEYLADNLDPQGRYKLLKACTNVRPMKDHVAIYVDPTRRGIPIDVERAWRRELDEFLEKADVYQAASWTVVLTAEDLQTIENIFTQLPQGMFSYKSSKIGLQVVRNL